MTDPQNPGGWDGRPENPERDGWHWLQRADDRWLVCKWWSAEQAGWVDGITLSPATVVEYGVGYLGPCLTSTEVAARVEAARREGFEAAADVASKRAASRHSTVAHCHSDRAKKHMQIRADEAGQLVAEIRALLEDGR